MASNFWSGLHTMDGSAADDRSATGSLFPGRLVTTPSRTRPLTTATIRTVATMRRRWSRLRLASRAAIWAWVSRLVGGRLLGLVLATARRLFRKKLDDPRHALGQVVVAKRVGEA